MTPSVVYALTRDELWHWYKKAWTRSLWPFHVFTLVMSIGLFLALNCEQGWVVAAVSGGFIGLIGCALMAAYPQIRYRPEERTLVLNEEGVRGGAGKDGLFRQMGQHWPDRR